MERKLRIAPSILAADFAQLGTAVREVERAGADLIHVDVMDGHFVPNITMGPVVVRALREITNLPLDVHLMIAEPARYVERFVEAGADIVIVHPEADVHIHRTLSHIRALGARAGAVLNPGTPERVLRYITAEVDVILVMTVNPGFSGQAFIPEMVSKVRRVRELLDTAGSAAWLAVDGGIGPETVAHVVRAGADTLVAGSAIFKADAGVAQAIATLRETAHEAQD
jgi:ribulose-phosphate 3-epimerase